MATKRVLIVDDHELIAEGIASAIKPLSPQTETALTYKDAKSLLTANTYDLLFLDLQLEDDEGDGRDLKIWMNQTGIKCPTVCMSGAYTPMSLAKLEPLKFDGFYSKADPVSELIAAVESLDHDGVFHSSDVIEKVDILKSAPALTNQQTQVMQRVVAGDSNKEIAHKLEITNATVSFHMKQLKSRLGVNNSREIGKKARELGLIE